MLRFSSSAIHDSAGEHVVEIGKGVNLISGVHDGEGGERAFAAQVVVDNLLPLLQAGANVDAGEIGHGLIINVELHVDSEKQCRFVYEGEGTGAFYGLEPERRAELLVYLRKPGLLDYTFDILATPRFCLVVSGSNTQPCRGTGIPTQMVNQKAEGGGLHMSSPSCYGATVAWLVGAGPETDGPGDNWEVWLARGRLQDLPYLFPPLGCVPVLSYCLVVPV